MFQFKLNPFKAFFHCCGQVAHSHILAAGPDSVLSNLLAVCPG